jgi:hypothetical protein
MCTLRPFYTLCAFDNYRQSTLISVAPRAGFEPATNRLTDVLISRL